MDKKIKSAFGEIKAEQELKTSTKYFILEQSNNNSKIKTPTLYKRLITVTALLIFTLFGSFLAYTTPVNAISLDGEVSSVELGINSFGKVVRITCFGKTNDANSLNLRNMNYNDAIYAIINSNEDYKNSSTLTVSCKSSDKGHKMAEQIRSNQSADTEVYCNLQNHKLSEEAHSLGISTGKYQMFLNLKEYEPELTAEQANSMTMKELRDRLSHYCSKDSSDTSEETETTTCNETHHNGQIGNGHHGGRQH